MLNDRKCTHTTSLTCLDANEYTLSVKSAVHCVRNYQQGRVQFVKLGQDPQENTNLGGQKENKSYMNHQLVTKCTRQC